MDQILKRLLASTHGYYHYVAAAGLVGRALYDFSVGEASAGVTSFCQGLALLGIGHGVQAALAGPGEGDGPADPPAGGTPPAPPTGASPSAAPAPPRPAVTPPTLRAYRPVEFSRN